MKFILSALTVFVISFLLPHPAQAAGASLYLSPSSGTFLQDSTFEVSVFVNTNNNSVNAVQASIKFPADKLQVVSPSAGNSFISLWISPPSYDNSKGTIILSGGLPTPGIKGSAALVSTIVFRVKASGTATVSFADDSSVLANDGAGTNILVSKIGANLTLKVPPPPGPIVSSPTHPDQTAWYRTDTLTLSWEKASGVTDFSYGLDQDPATIPDEVSEGGDNSKTYQALSEGVNYFHIRAKNGNTWGGTTNFLVQIDKTGPAKFTPTIYPSNRTSRTQPLVNFFTTDNLAGIDHYEVRIIDHSQSDAASLFTEQTSPYKLPALKPGRFTIVVRAVGRAGNHTDGTTELEIVPQLLPFSEDVLSFLESLPLINLALIALMIISSAVGLFVIRRRRQLNLPSRVTQDMGHLKEDLATLQAQEKDIERIKNEVQGTLNAPATEPTNTQLPIPAPQTPNDPNWTSYNDPNTTP